MFPLKLCIVTCVLYNLKISFIINFEFEYLSGLHRAIEVYDDPIFALLYLFCAKKHLFLALIFRNSIVLILCKIILSVRNNFTNDEHVFLRILVTNLSVLRFEKNEFKCMWTYWPFRHEVSLLYFGRTNLLSVLTSVCRHCNIKCF